METTRYKILSIVKLKERRGGAITINVNAFLSTQSYVAMSSKNSTTLPSVNNMEIIIIIKRISRAPIYHTRWQHRTLYNYTNHTHTHMHTRTHTHTYTHTVLDEGMGRAVKNSLEIIIKQVCLEGSFEMTRYKILSTVKLKERRGGAITIDVNAALSTQSCVAMSSKNGTTLPSINK